MGNPVLGEVGFRALGREWTFRLDFLALAQLDAERPGFLAARDTPTPAVVLASFHRGLTAHHEGITESEAAAIIDEITEIWAMKIIIESTSAGYAKASPPDPRIAAGTSKSS